MSSMSLAIAGASTRSIAAFFLVVGAKSSLIFVVAMLVTLAMRRRGAATRHLVWLGAVLAAALLPALTLIVPTWHMRVLATRSAVAPSVPATSPSEIAALDRLVGSRTLLPNGSGVPERSGERAAAAASALHATTRPTTAQHAALHVAAVPALIVIWAAGAVLLLSQIVLGTLFLRRVRNRATVVAEPGWQGLLRVVAERHEHVSLLVSGEVDVPVTWGILRPAILLPPDADEWTLSRRELVLRHELAHVTRHDVLTQLLARVVRALYWPNPLAWLAERNLRRECEQACDDAVLAAGVLPTRYAEELFAIVSELTARSITSLAPALGSRPSLETRLRALLDARLRRGRATRFHAASTGVAVLGLAIPLAAMTPAERPQPSTYAHRAEIARISSPPSPIPAPRIAPKTSSTVVKAAVSASALAGKASRTRAVAQLCAVDGGSHMNSTQEQQGIKTWEVHWSGRDCAVDLRAQGDIRFNDDLTDITSISRNGFFDLSLRQGDVLTRLVVKPAGEGELDRRYTVDGVERPWDDRAQDWFASVLLELDRQTGFAIDLRFPKLLARGVPAVFDEIEKLGGDYVRGLYFQRLIDRATLSPSEVRQTLELAGRDVRSDYELARILVAVSDRYGLPDEDTRAAFLKAVNALSSDYERNRTLFALLSRSDLSPREASAVLQSASALKSDYELARTLVAMTEKKLITPSLHALYLDDAGKISSDYERARVLLALLGTGELSKNEVAEVIALASGIKSDYERARVLVAIAGAYNLGDGARDAYVKAARSISSDYERSRALAALQER
jgi:beta-lactamase regulating signal transducer with metallopeptidase domain